jgi:hypothetical protein
MGHDFTFEIPWLFEIDILNLAKKKAACGKPPLLFK